MKYENVSDSRYIELECCTLDQAIKNIRDLEAEIMAEHPDTTNLQLSIDTGYGGGIDRSIVFQRPPNQEEREDQEARAADPHREKLQEYKRLKKQFEKPT